jgi:trans-aconitate methyltransferase
VVEQTRQTHWNAAYEAKGEAGVSWFEGRPDISLDLIHRIGARPGSSLIDVGGGASRLADALLDEGWTSLAVLDLSAAAIELAKTRISSRAGDVEWIVADITQWKPTRSFDVWHDRAAFHFLTDPADRAAYVDCLRAAVQPDGHAIIATFAPDGPERCSGLPVMRYDAAALAATVGPPFELVEGLRHVHTTPWGSTQAFQFSMLRRTG